MNSFFVAVVASLLIWGSTSGVCRAEGEMIVGLSTGYPPYYHKENGEFTGVCVDLMDRVAESLGIEIQYREYPWKRLITIAEKGHIDAIMPLFRTREREKFLYFDNLEIAKETNSFFTMRERDIDFDGKFQSLKGYTIGVVSGYSYGKNFDNYTKFDKVVTLKNSI